MIDNKKLLTAIIFFLPLLGTFLINIELTAVNLALTQIAENFSIPINETSSLLSLYLAFFAVFTMIGGKLGDLWGKKNITIWMLGIFILASLIGGCAEQYSVLLVSRGLQGLSAGAMLPNLTAILYNNAPAGKRSHIIGLISAVVGFSTASGPLIGSLITSYLNWRYIFFLNVPLGLLIMIGLFLFFKEKERTISSKKIDYKGMLLTIFLILFLMRIIDLFPSFDISETILVLVTFAILFCCWLVLHLKNENSFISLHLFKKKTFSMGCFVRMFLGFSYYIVLYVLGIFAQEVLHLKISVSGLIYLPMTLSVTFASLFYGKLSEKINIVTLLRGGLLIFLSGILIFLSFLNSIELIIAALVIMGCSYGILYSALFSITLHDIHESNTSEASGSLYFFNLLGGTLGVTFTGALLAVTKSGTLEQTLLSGVHYMMIFCAFIILACLIFSLVGIRRFSVESPSR